MLYWSEIKKWKIPTMAIGSNIPSGITFKKYPSSDQHQAPENPTILFHGHTTQISKPSCHQVTTRETTSDRTQTPRNWYVGQQHEYTDLVLRFVNGDIFRSDYQQLYALGLLSFQDILELIQPATVDTLPDDLLSQVFGSAPSDLDNFKAIPQSQLTQSICDRIFRLNKGIFRLIPDCFKTPTMCVEAITYLHTLFRYIPGDMVTESLVELLPPGLTYLSFDPTSMSDQVVEQLRKQMSPAALMRSTHPLIMRMPAKRDYQYYLRACEESWLSLKLIPAEVVTDEIILAAINDRYYALSLVPEERRKATLCDAAFKQSVRSLEFIPQHLVTEYHRDALISECATGDSSALLSLFHYIPEKLRTPDYYQAFVDYCLKHHYCFCELTEFSPPFLHTVLPSLLHGLKTRAAPLACHLQSLLLAAYAAPPSLTKDELIDFIKKIMLNSAWGMTITQTDFFSWLAIPGLEKAFKLELLHGGNRSNQART